MSLHPSEEQDTLRFEVVEKQGKNGLKYAVGVHFHWNHPAKTAGSAIEAVERRQELKITCF